VRRARNIVILVVLLFIAGVCLWVGAELRPPPRPPGKMLFRIPSDASAAQVALRLQERGLIRNHRLFLIAARVRGVDRKFRAGWYLIPGGLSALRLMDGLASGRLKAPAISVTLPEGLTNKEQARLFESAGLCSQEEFLKAAADSQAFKDVVRFPLPKGSLEGYLFPDTYLFERGTPPAKIVETMLRTFEKKAYLPLQEAFAKAPLRFEESVILASLVEAEARVPHERPIIAGVYLNRLRMGKRLECDATVQYALGERKKRLLYSDLEVQSPYNTYLHPGLPPGPICNPGLASLQAAVKPADVPYLYYVARGDGSHIFSRTFSEHQRAIREIRGR